MTKIAIISDIHSNYIALESILKDIEKRGVTDIYCLGDIVPKYSEPEKVIDSIRTNCKIVIKGNCDHSVVNNANFTYTWDKIGLDGLDYLDNLPLFHDMYISGKLVRMLHASPSGIDLMFNPYFSNVGNFYEGKEIIDFQELFLNTELIGKKDELLTPDAIIFGHTHTPFLFKINDKFIINPGSVGEPLQIVNENKKDDFLISSSMSYAIIEGNIGSNILSDFQVDIIEVPYLNLLREVREKVVSSNMATTKSLLYKIDKSIGAMR